jgi:hypothetical protein
MWGATVGVVANVVLARMLGNLTCYRQSSVRMSRVFCYSGVWSDTIGRYARRNLRRRS